MSDAMHLYVWMKGPMFLAIAQARSVDDARTLMIEEIGSSRDGSCPEREKAREHVKTTNPAIWHGPNAEFALTDSAELREQEAYSESLRLKLVAAKIEIARLRNTLTELLATLTPIVSHARFSIDHSLHSPSSHQEFIRQDGENFTAFEKARAKAAAVIVGGVR